MMDLSRLLRQWIVVAHVSHDGAPDGMGDPTETVTYTRWRGYVWQTQATENTANEEIERESWELALERRAASSNLDAGDRIILDGELDEDGELVPDVGETFFVAGPPWKARNPRTSLVEYVHARLERSA